MLLSKLAYECVKNVNYLADQSFNYESFRKGEFDTDMDYATNINNVFAPLNEAISRLNDLDRIAYRVVKVSQSKLVDMCLPFADVGTQVKEIIHIVQIKGDNNYRTIEYRNFGANKVQIISSLIEGKDLIVEYKVDIPYFVYDDVHLSMLDGVVIEDKDVDIKEEYGISISASSYIIEYVKGVLSEPIAPDLANMHITRAEQYFAGLKPIVSMFHQNVVENKYKIGD